MHEELRQFIIIIIIAMIIAVILILYGNDLKSNIKVEKYKQVELTKKEVNTIIYLIDLQKFKDQDFILKTKLIKVRDNTDD
jgi:hypothetical protein